MKLYYFNPNNYGSEYFVMAKNRNHAYKSLLNYFKNKIDKNDNYKNFYIDELIEWEKNTFPSGYSLDEYNAGIVIESEIA